MRRSRSGRTGSGRMMAIFISLMMIFCTVIPSNTAVKAASSRDALKAEIDQAEAELAQLKVAQAEAADQWGRGILGYVEYMLEKDDLTALQISDLNKAKTVLENAMEESFNTSKMTCSFPESRNNKVVQLYDRYDANSLDYFKIIIYGMREINRCRAEDDLFVGPLKCNDATTNFALTAAAVTSANRGAAYTNHSVMVANCECLAFGWGAEGVTGWYEEKQLFEKAMAQLGMTKITSKSDVDKVTAKATENGDVVGHYTGLFMSKEEVMGVGFAEYGKYRDTMSYNGNVYNGNVAVYTIDEFEEMYLEYYETIEPEQFETAIAEKQRELDELYSECSTVCTNHRFATSGNVNADCVTDGYSWRKCADCGYYEKFNPVKAYGHNLQDGICSRCGIKTVKSFTYVFFKNGDEYCYGNSQTHEEGTELSVSLQFDTAKLYKGHEEFVFEVSDPTVIKFVRENNIKGRFVFLKPGLCDITIYPKEVPSLKMEYHMDVTDVGGHNYVIEPLQDGHTTSHAICSKCGLKREVEIPTDITFFGFNSTSNPHSYSEGNMSFAKNASVGYWIKLTGDKYYPGLDNNDVVIESSDDSVVRVVTSSYSSLNNGCMGNFATGRSGIAVITAYLKYNPKVKVSTTVGVSGDGDVKVSSIKVDKTSVNLDLSKNPTGKINLTYSPSNATVKGVRWYIGNRDIAELDAEGNVTAKSLGRTYVQGTSLDGSDVDTDWIYINVYDTPAAPNVRTSDFTVTETTIKSKLSGGFEYRINKNGTWSSWSSTGSWTGLTVNTTYQIGVRVKANPSGYINAGDEKTVNVSTSNHTPVTLHAVAPTCTEPGLSEGTQCSECKEILKPQKTIPATGHDVVVIEATDATCTSNGMTEGKYCSVCNTVLVTQKVVPAKGHKMVTDYAVPESCTEDGWTEGRHCSVCGMVEVKQERVPAIGHSWDIGVVTTEPTCRTEGVRTFTCHNCGETKTQSINRLNHGLVIDDKVEPTCTNTGLTSGAHCPLCGEVFSEQTIIPAKGHSYGEWIQDPDDVNLIYRICSVCHEKESSEHRWDEGTVKVAATCTTDGIKVYKCEDCDASYEETISASGHCPEIIKGHDADCRSEGLSDGIVCSVCKEVIKEQTVLSVSDHHWNEGVTTREQSYDEEGIVLYTCTVCGETAEDYLPKLKKEGWFKEEGEWRYYTDGSLYDGSKGNLVYAKLDGVSGWYMVTGGKIDYSFIGIAKTTSGKWQFAQNGMADSSFSGIALATNNIWYYVTDGKIDRTFTDKIAYCTNGKWYYVRNGKPTKSFTDKIAYCTNGNWYYVKDGRPYTKFTGKIAHATDGNWYYCTNGRPDKKFTGIAMATNGTWYYVSKGILDKSFTGVAISTNGAYYYAKKGVLDKTFNGIASDISGKQYYLKNGKVNASYSGTVTYNGKKYKIVNGVVTK